MGRIYDDRGHRMTPSHARKRGTKYRYYLSSALLQGGAKQAGTVSRIPADEIEALVANLFVGTSICPPRSRMQFSSKLMSSGSRSNQTSW